jgi:hypothetical protein
MRALVPAGEVSTVRRVFATWSIEIPVSFAETFVSGDGYWHAFCEDRSISLTSIVVSDGERMVSAAELMAVGVFLPGSPVEDMPPGLRGSAVTCPSIPPARASKMLSGFLATDGRLLVVTITSDDLEWARAVWLSIRNHPAPDSLIN